jgi:hypothetical protein
MNTYSSFEAALREIESNSFQHSVVVGVLDTAEFVRLWAQERGIDDPEILLGLTKTILAERRWSLESGTAELL